MEPTNQVFSAEVQRIRKEIRNKIYNHYIDPDLKIALVDVESIKFRINKLEKMGCCVKEFKLFTTDLLLTQLENLQRIVQKTCDGERKKIEELIMTTRKILWPEEVH